MSSISVLPGFGTQSAVIDVVLVPDGSAAPSHVPVSAAGATGTPMTEASAQALAAATKAFSTTLLPFAQVGPFIFGFPP